MMWTDTDKDSAGQKGTQYFKPNGPDLSRGGTIDPSENQGWIDQYIQQQRQSKFSVPPPIKVFTVCVDQMSGKYMAFLGSDPAKKAVADSRLGAVAALLAEQKLIVMAEID